MSKIVRISDEAYSKLTLLESELDASKQDVIIRALEILARETLLARANKAFKALRDNPKLWQEELEERKELEGTLGDGLDEQ
jgi:predicted CopG family antitoxin